MPFSKWEDHVHDGESVDRLLADFWKRNTHLLEGELQKEHPEFVNDLFMCFQKTSATAADQSSSVYCKESREEKDEEKKAKKLKDCTYDAGEEELERLRTKSIQQRHQLEELFARIEQHKCDCVADDVRSWVSTAPSSTVQSATTQTYASDVQNGKVVNQCSATASSDNVQGLEAFTDVFENLQQRIADLNKMSITPTKSSSDIHPACWNEAGSDITETVAIHKTASNLLNDTNFATDSGFALRYLCDMPATDGNRASAKEPRTIAKALKKTMARVQELTRANDALTRQLEEENSKQIAAATHRVESELGEARNQLKDVKQSLTKRENENLELIHTFYDLKKELSEAQCDNGRLQVQLKAAQDEQFEALAALEKRHAVQLRQCSEEANAKVANMENEKGELMQEKSRLESKLESMAKDEEEGELARAKVQRYADQGVMTETEAGSNELESLVEDLQRQLYEALWRLDEMEEDRKIEESKCGASQATDDRHKLKELAEQLESQYKALKEEFEHYRQVCNETQQQANKRIAFLVSCVEESASLVDKPNPSSKKQSVVTPQTIHDTVLRLSEEVALYSQLYPSQQECVRVINKSQSGRRPRTMVSVKPFPPAFTSNVAEVNPSQVSNPPHTVLTDEEKEDCAYVEMEHTLDLWRTHAAALEQSMCQAVLRNETLEEVHQQSQAQMKEMRQELKHRLNAQSQMTEANARLEGEVEALQQQVKSTSVRHSEHTEELYQLRSQLHQLNLEAGRLRASVGRKDTLLSTLRSKKEALEKEVDGFKQTSDKKSELEKKASVAQQRYKEQLREFQEKKRDWSRQEEEHSRVKKELVEAKEDVKIGQNRLASVKRDNARLRSQIKHLKGMQDFSSATTKCDRCEDREKEEGEVQALKRRILQKQKVVSTYRTKVEDLEQRLEKQSSHIEELKSSLSSEKKRSGQTQRSMETKLESVKQVRQDALSEATYRLDGLRASVYDSFEVYVHCTGDNCGQTVSDCGSFSSFQQNPLEHSGLEELSRWTELSLDDLTQLQDSTSKSQRKEGREMRGRKALKQLEAALESSPEDCRREICHLLGILSNSVEVA